MSRFMISFLCLTYLSTRPCFYCTILLLILLASSCHWSDNCFFDLNSNFFELRHFSSPLPNPLPYASSRTETCADKGGRNGTILMNAVNDTASALAGLAVESLGRRLHTRTEWTGIGFGWLRSLLGAREWRIPCVDVLIRL